MPEDDKPGGGGSAPAPRLKAKLPSAQGIKRPDFTPHGISAGRDRRMPARPSPLTAAQARKRRRITIAALLVVALAAGGLGYWWFTRPGPTLEVTGAFGKEPKVEIPDEVRPTGKHSAKVLIQGKGARLAANDLVYLHFAYYRWPGTKPSPSAGTGQGEGEGQDNGKIASSYAQGGPRGLTVGRKDATGLDKAIDKALIGQPVGSRVMVEVPPKDLGQAAAEFGLAKNDSLLFVLDLVKAFPSVLPDEQKKFDEDGLPTVEAKKGQAPEVKVPDEEAPDKLVIKTLIEGKGPAVAKGDQVMTNYKGVIWDSGKEFDSSWKNGSPQPFEIGTGKTIPGFDKGLVGVKAGSRVMLVLPPKEGYGKEGNEQAGIKGDDTLVFIVDVLGTAPK
ncbi:MULTISPECIES: FKBP-type peptidyl-prolyl cis-trans isomerase [Thermomonospora]|uniref:peptidylprolyl isomerase n=1 Tax=Thermomonospora cellulosilytica TaxID=1411118 RepID=A0A7W3MY37_9ACTN|nr:MULTISPECIES: FKBP-type peptidyl-prolyl cis-trans isomerase [Thermomonospora]MBA9003996.1 peptidylprolyl isomerase [Thermomonospora cellulosilytica]